MDFIITQKKYKKLMDYEGSTQSRYITKTKAGSNTGITIATQQQKWGNNSYKDTMSD